MNTRPKKVVWCLSDGRPGHFNQTKGMIAALSHGFELEVYWVEIKLKLPPLRKLLRLLLNNAPERFSGVVAGCYRYDAPQANPDLILSTGGNTSFLNIALAQQYQCSNFFIGSLRGLKPSRFSQVFTIEPIGAENNTVMELAPTPVSWTELQQKGSALKEQSQYPLWTMLIGAETKEFPFAERDWQSLAESMNSLARVHNIRWLVTTSRRTGGEVESKLAGWLDPQYLQDVVWYSQEPRKVMASYLGAADVVFCTADSLSMLTEGISAGKPVIAATISTAQPEQRYAQALQRLQSKGWLALLDVSELSVVTFGELAPIDREPGALLWQQVSEKGLLRINSSASSKE